MAERSVDSQHGHEETGVVRAGSSAGRTGKDPGSGIEMTNPEDSGVLRVGTEATWVPAFPNEQAQRDWEDHVNRQPSMGD